MQIIKKDIGPDAVIMSSKQVRKKKGPFGLFGKKEFEVVAGFEEEEAPKSFQAVMTEREAAERSVPQKEAVLPEKPENEIAESVNELKGLIEQLNDRMAMTAAAAPPQAHFSGEVASLYQRMTQNGVEARAAEEICAQTEMIAINRKADAEEVAVSLVKDMLGSPCPIEVTKYRRRTVMLAGPSGVGKTTTLIKLAYMLVYQRKLNVGIVNADSFRVAAKEHIEAYCKILKTDMITIYKPEELKDALDAFADKDVVLIDTAGKVSDDKEYLMDIAKLVSIGKVDEIHITLSASTSEHVLRSTLDNYSFLKKHSIIVTKTDETPQRGIFLYLAQISGRPFSYITTGQNVPDDIKLADPSEIAEAIMGK